METTTRSTSLDIINEEEKLYMASQWQLMWRKFKKHKLAIFGAIIILSFYFVAIFCEFFATNDIAKRNTGFIYAPPQKIHFYDGERLHLRPFVYKITQSVDPETWERIYTEDKSEKYPIHFFVRGHNYKFFNIFESDIHLMGVERGNLFLFGTDEAGRDLFSRILYATRISLSLGIVGVAFSFILGCILGGVSGFYGGIIDVIIQRVIEFLLSIPKIPLWMALAAALPQNWSVLQIYFAITVILSIVGWCGLARVVRGKLLELKKEDYILAAKISGTKDSDIIRKHLLPGFLSYLIVNITLAIPNMIIGETALSFLGIGLRPPVVSWGVLLKNAQNIQTLSYHPWLLIPGVFVIIAILGFNFLGDGLRDAADPYK